ncbi:MAG: ribonuclease Y [Rhodothermales bacterium]
MDITAVFGDLIAVAVVALCIVVGIIIDRFLLSRSVRVQVSKARDEAKRLLDEAEQEVKRIRFERIEKVEADIAMREETLQRETQETKRSLRRMKHVYKRRLEKLSQRTQRIAERESVLQKATEAIELLRKEGRGSQREAERLRRAAAQLAEDLQGNKAAIERKEQEITAIRTSLQTRQEKMQQVLEEQTRKLEQVSGMSPEEARHAMIERYVEEARLEAAGRVKEIRDEAKLTANRQARKVILTAIQRTAASHAIENTVSVVNIQSDEMKGRIIGREGRNIRAFEATTGIEVIVDDTPEAVILSGFDPIRREVARISLVRLIQDGRIHPARIEEVVEKVREEVNEEIMEVGERTAIDLNLHGMHPELIRQIGRMRYRTSYGQNLLAHSIETAHISSLIAAELGLDVNRACRAGLLHDIGKVVEEDIENPHAIVGMELCEKYKEHPDVCNAVGAHHDEIEMTCLIAPVVQAADAISGARPGARREALESYIKRLEKLEDLARSFNGVERVYAIQAGREIRVLVNHDLVSDAEAENLAVDISKKIQNELQYPGQVKVTVIREVRSVSYAK